MRAYALYGGLDLPMEEELQMISESQVLMSMNAQLDIYTRCMNDVSLYGEASVLSMIKLFVTFCVKFVKLYKKFIPAIIALAIAFLVKKLRSGATIEANGGGGGGGGGGGSSSSSSGGSSSSSGSAFNWNDVCENLAVAIGSFKETPIELIRTIQDGNFNFNHASIAVGEKGINMPMSSLDKNVLKSNTPCKVSKSYIPDVKLSNLSRGKQIAASPEVASKEAELIQSGKMSLVHQAILAEFGSVEKYLQSVSEISVDGKLSSPITFANSGNYPALIGIDMNRLKVITSLASNNFKPTKRWRLKIEDLSSIEEILKTYGDRPLLGFIQEAFSGTLNLAVKYDEEKKKNVISTMNTNVLLLSSTLIENGGKLFPILKEMGDEDVIHLTKALAGFSNEMGKIAKAKGEDVPQIDLNAIKDRASALATFKDMDEVFAHDRAECLKVKTDRKQSIFGNITSSLFLNTSENHIEKLQKIISFLTAAEGASTPINDVISLFGKEDGKNYGIFLADNTSLNKNKASGEVMLASFIYELLTLLEITQKYDVELIKTALDEIEKCVKEFEESFQEMFGDKAKSLSLSNIQNFRTVMLSISKCASFTQVVVKEITNVAFENDLTTDVLKVTQELLSFEYAVRHFDKIVDKKAKGEEKKKEAPKGVHPISYRDGADYIAKLAKNRGIDLQNTKPLSNSAFNKISMLSSKMKDEIDELNEKAGYEAFQYDFDYLDGRFDPNLMIAVNEPERVFKYFSNVYLPAFRTYGVSENEANIRAHVYGVNEERFRNKPKTPEQKLFAKLVEFNTELRKRQKPLTDDDITKLKDFNKKLGYEAARWEFPSNMKTGFAKMYFVSSKLQGNTRNYRPNQLVEVHAPYIVRENEPNEVAFVGFGKIDYNKK